ncbi:MAG: hypothetical protein A2X59_04035 [Nitrospirae bacterium GWC2_42_7]|nr:MAG: hypothetical protein A2X59_04035 [Nitrospirae bacterium GWC2_42_7]
MIKNTFCILDGIGEKLERRLWEEGVLTWEDFRNSDRLFGFSHEKKSIFDERLQIDAMELGAGNAEYFDKRIKRREHWRLFDFFKDQAVCLDIETNGLPPGSGGYATVVGLYDGYDYKCFIKGENLNAANLNRELEKYKYIVTFYGAVFDVPFLLRTFDGLKLNIPHYDLCFASRKLMMKGGLKKLEVDLGIGREESVQGLGGYEAVKLWESARRGSHDAMDLLVKYNKEDTVNLLQLGTILYEKLKQSTGIEEYLSCGVA